MSKTNKITMKHAAPKNKHGYCGVTTLANLFPFYSDLLSYINDESYFAAGEDKFNEILEKEGHVARFLPICNMFGNIEIDKDFSIKILKSNAFYKKENGQYKNPILIFHVTAQLGDKEDTHHSIGIIRYYDDFFMSDPAREEIIHLYDISELYSKIKYLSSIYIIGVKDEGENKAALIDADAWGFGELIEECKSKKYEIS